MCTEHDERSSGPAAPPDDLHDLAAEALFQLGRSFARLSLVPEREIGTDRARPRIQVCLAIAGAGQSENGPTVGQVAEALAIEPSTASRLVAQTVAAGLVRSEPSATDRRRQVLALTTSGTGLVERARQYQRQVFDELTGSWEPIERETFARLLPEFVAGVIQRTAAERARLGQTSADA